MTGKTTLSIVLCATSLKAMYFISLFNAVLIIINACTNCIVLQLLLMHRHTTGLRILQLAAETTSLLLLKIS